MHGGSKTEDAELREVQNFLRRGNVVFDGWCDCCTPVAFRCIVSEGFVRSGGGVVGALLYDAASGLVLRGVFVGVAVLVTLLTICRPWDFRRSIENSTLRRSGGERRCLIN